LTRANFSLVSEAPGLRASAIQKSMLYTRYHVATERAAGKDVLEVACGPGMGLGLLQKHARRVVAGDYDPTLLSTAARSYAGRIPLLRLDAHALPFANGSFDLILLYEAVYYLRCAPRFVGEARRLLRPGGTLLICTVNQEWDGFNPSPLSFRYYSADELIPLLSSEGFAPEVFGAFPAAPHSRRGRIVAAIRRFAVSWHLIPRTMRGKEFLKRMFMGKLDEIPAELPDGMAPVEPLRPLCASGTTPMVLYAFGTVPSE